MKTAEKLTANADQSFPNVLIVEDEDDIRTLLNLLCEGEGCDVALASNGIDAIAEVVDNAPDIAIIDYFMPRMDGEKTASAVRSLAPQAHIIAFSGSLVGKPYWADSYVAKNRMFDLPGLIRSLGERHLPAPVVGELVAA